MTSDELVIFEIEQFKQGWGKNLCFDRLTAQNVDSCLTHALSDALNQGARRNKVEYKTKLNEILSSVKTDLFAAIATGSILISDANDYKQNFLSLKDAFRTALTSNGLEKLAEFGFAQKFISMSFKYLYCFDDCDRENLRFCYLPLDQYTIDWYKKYGSKSLIDKFKSKNFAWSNIEDELYFEIQSDIDVALAKGIDYPINCKYPTQTVKLPENKIEVEFITWMQQRLNDVYNNSLSVLKAYYDRLGIKEA